MEVAFLYQSADHGRTRQDLARGRKSSDGAFMLIVLTFRRKIIGVMTLHVNLMLGFGLFSYHARACKT